MLWFSHDQCYNYFICTKHLLILNPSGCFFPNNVCNGTYLGDGEKLFFIRSKE